MTVRQLFQNAIRRGTGETHLLMKVNPKVDFSNDIIKAALTNFSYDNQSEGSRAVYVFELIELSNQKEKIRQAVLKALATERVGTWALDQLFDIAALFSKQGDKEAKKAIYKRFYKKTYLDTILKYKHSTPKRERPKYNYELVTERINSKAIDPLPRAVSKEISKSDIKKLAADFLKETKRFRQEKYMRVFVRIKFPYDYQPILEIAKGKYSSKDRLIEYAVNALRHFSGKDIRTFAVAQIPKAKRPDVYTNLLIANYKKGDSNLLQTLVDKTNNEHIIHDLVFSYVDIYRANMTKDCKAPLVALYGKPTCGLHREDIVKIMIENAVLSDRIRKEIKYDSYNETRKLYANKKNGL